MNVSRDDLKRLRVPLALAVLLSALGAACLATSGYYLDAAKSARDASRQTRVGAQERMAKVSEEEREIRENLVHYEQMQLRGMVGEQNRLDWIESIARIKNDRKLFEIRYNIEAQRSLDYPGVIATGAADFVVSRVRLNMLLLHEGDLLNFLADLQAAGKAHVSVRRCSVTRIERGAPSATALQPRLRAECLVDLVSVRGIKPV
jgi:cell division protein FtsB